MMDSKEAKEAIQALAGELMEVRRGMAAKVVYNVSGLYMNLVGTCFIYRDDLHGEPEGLILPANLSHQSIHIASFIREHCYVKDAGTWYSMTFTLNPDNSADIVLNFDDEPLRFGQSLDPEQYELEMLKFPVVESKRPTWLKSKFKSGSM
jgi:hypothetical protein